MSFENSPYLEPPPPLLHTGLSPLSSDFHQSLSTATQIWIDRKDREIHNIDRWRVLSSCPVVQCSNYVHTGHTYIHKPCLEHVTGRIGKFESDEHGPWGEKGGGVRVDRSRALGVVENLYVFKIHGAEIITALACLPRRAPHRIVPVIRCCRCPLGIASLVLSTLSTFLWLEGS